MSWLAALGAVLAFAQAGSTGALPPVSQDRLTVCLDAARTDPPTAIAAASEWAGEALGEAVPEEAGLPQQCLGFAYMSLLRWDAAAEAFLDARDLRAPDDRPARARLGAMAGSAALASGDYPAAIATLSIAQADAEAAGLNEIAGGVAADRARALVAAGRAAEAGEVLAGAQVLAPQAGEVWLLSAALARRQGDLNRAQSLVATGLALAPEDLEILLEGGLIAALASDDASARTLWERVVALDGASPHAATARAYLAQIEQGAPLP